MKGVTCTGTLPKLDHWETDYFASYTGSDRKDGLISPDGERYLIKYAEEHTRQNGMDTSYVNNVLAEYISSHILTIIGYDVHETFPATRNGELLVACKNFTDDDHRLIEFGMYLRKHYDSGEIDRVPDLGQIRYVLNHDPTLRPYADELWTSYCERFVGDSLVGNFDRHMGNFGYLVTREGSVTVSPIYDNGSTLFPALSEHAMREEILSDPKEIMRRVLLFPKAALTVNGPGKNVPKVRYYDMLSSGYEPEFTKAVKKMVPIIRSKMPEIEQFIDGQVILSDTRKSFYKTIINARMQFLLEPSYEQCVAADFDRAAYDRLAVCGNYTNTMFEQEYTEMLSNPFWREKIENIL